MNELTVTEKKEILPFAESFLENAKQDMEDIGKRYFMLGCRLHEAQIYNYVETLGYDNIEQLAEAELDLGRSSTYNLIKVFKRFCARNEHGDYKTWVDPKYKNYSYSQLIEMEKAYCLSYDIEKEIPPNTPVRIIKEYVKYINKNPGDHKSLPDWQNEEQLATLSPISNNKQIKGQLSIEDTASNNVQFDKIKIISEENNVTNPLKTPESATEAIQTFGLPTYADNKDVGVDETKYNFAIRAGVRAFLADYENWERYYGFIGCFFGDMYFYKFKNGMIIYAVTIETLVGTGEELVAIKKITYFLDYEKRKAKEITKEQIEKFCAKYKNEL